MFTSRFIRTNYHAGQVFIPHPLFDFLLVSISMIDTLSVGYIRFIINIKRQSSKRHITTRVNTHKEIMESERSKTKNKKKHGRKLSRNVKFVSIMLRFLGPMPGGDHSSPGRVRKPVGAVGPPSPSGVLPAGARNNGSSFSRTW